jgi:hypothetical protein
MSIPTVLVDTTFTAKNIATAASVCEYTATANCTIRVQVCLAAVAGGGDYIAYLTLNDGDTVADLPVLPKTTMTAAAGETAFWFATMSVDVMSGDVINVFVDGGATDTNESGSIRIFTDNWLAPTTDGRTLDVTATGAAGIDWSNIENKTSTVDLSATQTNDDATTWAYASRTLTQGAASVVSAVSGTEVTGYKYATLSFTLTGLTDFTGWTKLWFTAKNNVGDADAVSMIQIVESSTDAVTDGLLYINGAAATTLTNGSITVNSTTSITVTVEAVEMAKLPTCVLFYDVKVLTATAVVAVSEGGHLSITDVVTRTYS